VANKRSYAIGVLVVYQTFQLASRFVTSDTDAAPKSPTAHTANVSANQGKERNVRREYLTDIQIKK